jgi:hypothetical protein
MEHFFTAELIKVPNSLATADPTTKNIVVQAQAMFITPSDTETGQC